jgi:Flp pilus assembly protein TadD
MSRWFLAGVLLQMLSLLPVFITERYRLAAVPGLVLFAVLGGWLFWQACVSRRIGGAIGYVVLLCGSAALVSKVPTDPGLWALDPYNAGRAALDAGDLTVAQRKLELAHSYVPENAEINLALGNLWLERGDAARAEQFYHVALSLEPKHRAALSNLAVLALRQHEPARATGLLRSAIGSGPAEAKLHYLLAKAEHDLGNAAVALSEIETAIRLKPDQAEFAEFRREITGQNVTPPQ